MTEMSRAAILWVLVCGVLACRRTESSDPWSVKDDPDAPPSLAERHRHVEAACPRVTAPYFFSIEKAGKTSYILGTRHISVPLAKFPANVLEHLRAAKLAVF